MKRISTFILINCFFMILFFLSLSTLSAQIKMSYGDRCAVENSVQMADVFLACLNKDVLIDIIDTKSNVLIMCELDSLGAFVSISRLKNIVLSDSQLIYINKYIKNHNIRFTYCWASENKYLDQSKLLENLSTTQNIIISFNILSYIIECEYQTNKSNLLHSDQSKNYQMYIL